MVWGLSPSTIYASVRSKIVYSGSLKKDVLADMVSATSVEEALGRLRETSYYQFVRDVDVKDPEALELGLYVGLYRSILPLMGLTDKGYRTLIDLSLSPLEARIASSILVSLASGRVPGLRLDLFEGLRIGSVYRAAVEEKSFSRALEQAAKSGLGYLVDMYNVISKGVEPRKAIAVASDLGAAVGMRELSRLFPSISKLVCPELDFTAILTIFRLSRGSLREQHLMDVLTKISCSLSKNDIEDLLSRAGDEAVIGLLRRIYGQLAVQGGLAGSLDVVRGQVKKLVRKLCERAMISYPFDPSLVWASIRIRMFDVEDIVVVINGKKALLSQDLLKAYLSVSL